MRRWLLVVLVILTGCQSTSTSPKPSKTATPIQTSNGPTTAPSATTSAAALPTFRSVCSGFDHFYGAMSSKPPSEQWGHLIDLATAVDRAPGPPKMHRLADALLTYVTASSFPHQGNLAGQPVQNLSDACF